MNSADARKKMYTRISWRALFLALDNTADALGYVAYRVQHHAPEGNVETKRAITKHLYAGVRHIKAAAWGAYKVYFPNKTLPKYHEQRLSMVEFRARTREVIRRKALENKKEP